MVGHVRTETTASPVPVCQGTVEPCVTLVGTSKQNYFLLTVLHTSCLLPQVPKTLHLVYMGEDDTVLHTSCFLPQVPKTLHLVYMGEDDNVLSAVNHWRRAFLYSPST